MPYNNWVAESARAPPGKKASVVGTASSTPRANASAAGNLGTATLPATAVSADWGCVACPLCGADVPRDHTAAHMISLECQMRAHERHLGQDKRSSGALHSIRRKLCDQQQPADQAHPDDASDASAGETEIAPRLRPLPFTLLPELISCPLPPSSPHRPPQGLLRERPRVPVRTHSLRKKPALAKDLPVPRLVMQTRHVGLAPENATHSDLQVVGVEVARHHDSGSARAGSDRVSRFRVAITMLESIFM